MLRPIFETLFSPSEDCGHHTRAATSVHHGDNPQGLFIRRVRDQVFVNDDEAQRTRGQVRAFVALMRKRHKPSNGVKYLLSNTTGRSRAIVRDKCPNIGDVLGRERVKVKTPRHGYSFLRISSSRW